jgi:hypothetical protein
VPSATPRLDVSASWPVHTCGYRHAPVMAGRPCPRPGVWLVSGERVETGRACTVTPILHAPGARR